MLPLLHLITISSMKLAFCCLLASIAFLRFSVNLLFFAALLLALVSDIVERRGLHRETELISLIMPEISR